MRTASGRDPSQSWSNLLYLLYYVALVVGLLRFPDAVRSREDALKFGLDAATVVVGGGMVVWHFVIAPTVSAGGQSAFQLVTSVCYPLGDLTGAARPLRHSVAMPERRATPPIVLLAGSVSAMMIGDLVWANLALNGDYQAGNIQDVLFMTRYVLLTSAAAEELRRSPNGEAEREDGGLQPFYLLPYASVALGYGLLLYVGHKGATPQLFQLMLGAVALTVLVLGRQMAAVRENVRLSRERLQVASEADSARSFRMRRTSSASSISRGG